VQSSASLPLTLLLGLLIALTALAIDSTLPALPALASAFGAEAAAAQFTLTSFFVGVALGQLAWGPLSDRFGRRPTMLAGLALCAAASALAPLAPDLGALAVARAIQGLGTSACAVIARTVVRDLYSHEHAAQLLARMMIVFGLVPLVGPFIGGRLLAFRGWGAVFWLHAAVATALLIWVARGLGETAPGERRTLAPRRIAAAFGELLAHRGFVAAFCVLLAMQVGIMAWITGSAFVLIRGFGVSPDGYALLFALVMIGQISGAWASSRLVMRHGIARMLRAGTTLGALSGGAMAALAFAGVAHWSAVVLPMLVFLFASSLVLPHATAAALTPFPGIAGTATSLMGSVQFACGALAGAALGAAFDGTARPLAAAVAAGGVAAFASLHLLYKPAAETLRGPR
jgi:DHA1 family bicyclomycin/chloramphenicol resistance-like MFS transporter